MSYKTEVIDALEVYKRNTAHVLGADSDMVRAIDRCMILADEVVEEQPEQLTDKEQRIFLAAMGREEKVCKQVDEECRDCREPYEDTLVRNCHEIIRKVKAALWGT